MWEVLSWLLVIALGAGLIAGGYWYYATQLSGGDTTSGLFGNRPEKRLSISEQSNVDGRRKLVLIKRDDVEHLIMTGGPVDVVIETNIGDKARDYRQEPRSLRETDRGDRDGTSTPVFTRTPRNFGKAVGE